MKVSLFSTLTFFFIIGLGFLYMRSPVVSVCDRCMYSSCSSLFILSSCENIQKDHIDGYFSQLKNSPTEMDKILLYGKNMGECFSLSREYCRSTHCANECGVENFIIASSNTVTESETATVSDTRTENYLVQFDSCYARNIDISSMYFRCILSPLEMSVFLLIRKISEIVNRKRCYSSKNDFYYNKGCIFTLPESYQPTNK